MFYIFVSYRPRRYPNKFNLHWIVTPRKKVFDRRFLDCEGRMQAIDASFLFNLEGTSLASLPPELHHLIQSYWIAHRRYQEKPAIKPSYQFKKNIGACWNVHDGDGSTYGKDGQFQYPFDGCQDKNGNIYIPDALWSNIQVFDKEG